MKKLLFSLFLVIVFLASFTAPLEAATLGKEFTSLVEKTGLEPTKQAVCIDDAGQSPLSKNASMRITPASVSKLYVFDFALSSLPNDFRYTTKFVVNGSTLYINGGGDPHFVIGHLRSVIQKIYDEKGVRLSTFIFSPDFYFNWQSNSKDVQAALFNSLKSDTSLPIASKIRVTPGATSYRGVGDVYTFQSAPLITLLKQINDYSTNISADTLFKRLGGPTAFANYMKREYGVGTETISFSTGSGLTGNYTTCELTLQVLHHLAQRLEKDDLPLTAILSMPTVDPGVLQKRFINPADAQFLVAKSGFVNFHHALAGAINTKKGPTFFAIFTEFPDMKKSDATKKMIDAFVGKMVAQYRNTLRSFNYTPDIAIFDNIKIARVLR